MSIKSFVDKMKDFESTFLFERKPVKYNESQGDIGIFDSQAYQSSSRFLDTATFLKETSRQAILEVIAVGKSRCYHSKHHCRCTNLSNTLPDPVHVAKLYWFQITHGSVFVVLDNPWVCIFPTESIVYMYNYRFYILCR